MSIPTDQLAGCPLGGILPPELARKLENFETEMLLSPEELGAVFQETAEPGCYHDPVLERSPRQCRLRQ